MNIQTILIFLSIFFTSHLFSPLGFASEPDAPLKSIPYSPSLNLGSLDKSVDPCVDFYSYSCGGWMKKNPIPSDQSKWSVYGKLSNENRKFIWGLLTGLGKKVSHRSPEEQRLGDYFAACMDEPTIESLGFTPLKSTFEMISALQSKDDLANFTATQLRENESMEFFFGFGATQDYENSDQIIAYLDTGGLGLPDRDLYTKEDSKSADIRKKYVAHMEKMFTLIGESEKEAHRHAETSMKIETELAKASLTRVERRDPYRTAHKMSLKEMADLAPHFNWAHFFSKVGLENVKTFQVTEKKFYEKLDRLLKKVSLDDWKTFLRWKVVDANAWFLSDAFVQEDFNFYQKTLKGAQEIKPRWKRCTDLIDAQLGEALGKVYVDHVFKPQRKKSTQTMVRQIEAAMEQEILSLDWMSPETKKRAIEKLKKINNKVGYPEHFREYSSLEIKRDDFIGNVRRGRIFENNRELAKIGKPVDRNEWDMTPPTVNAYYDPQLNDINFPAGVLQPPLYDPKMDAAPNYGNSGSTIGHELTHAFDDEGRQFDGWGNLKDWWTKNDESEFKKRAECVSKQYSNYTILEDIKVNGELTLGENVADLGGVRLAYLAWRESIKNQRLKMLDGFTPDQRFFIGYAQWACENTRPETQRLNAITNPHSPGRYRINGTVSNLSEFQTAFSCQKGQPMVNETRCQIW